MTHRLYYTNSYLCDFEAAVIRRTDDDTRIYLDQTAFYPTSGGQLFDTGELGGISVVDVIDEGEQIAHLMEAPLLDQRVIGRVDWARRFDHMQQHTGQHLLSAVIAETLGRKTLSVHFGEETATVDLDGAPPTVAEICQVESRANQMVTDNRPVEVQFQESAAAEGLREASAREGRLRIITIQDLDRSACGGTHVRATGEIGPILIRKVERFRAGSRLEFVCGGRAIRYARADYDLLTRSAAALTASPAELPHLIESMRSDLKGVRARLQEMRRELDQVRAGELYSATTPGSDGIRWALSRRESGPLEQLKGLGQAFASLPRAIFVGATREPPGLIVTASEDSGVDAGKVLKSLLAGTGGRGGGSAGLAQAVLPNAAELERVIQSLLHKSSK